MTTFKDVKRAYRHARRLLRKGDPEAFEVALGQADMVLAAANRAGVDTGTLGDRIGRLLGRPPAGLKAIPGKLDPKVLRVIDWWDEYGIRRAVVLTEGPVWARIVMHVSGSIVFRRVPSEETRKMKRAWVYHRKGHDYAPGEGQNFPRTPVDAVRVLRRYAELWRSAYTSNNKRRVPPELKV